MLLMRKEIAGLRKVAEAATEQKCQNMKYICTRDRQNVGEVIVLVSLKQAGRQEGGEKPRNRACGERLWALQRNWKQCTHLQGRIEDSEDSNKSRDYFDIVSVCLSCDDKIFHSGVMKFGRVANCVG